MIENREQQMLEKHIQETVDKFNNTPVDDFEGYSANEMEFILYHTFEKESPIQITKLKDEEYAEMPLFNQVRYLLKIIEKEGELKLTKLGYLPPKIVIEIYEQGFIKDYSVENGLAKVYKESDLMSINLTKMLIEISPFVKKRNNKLSLTKKGKESLVNHHLLFETIFVLFATKFNWAYFDGYDNDYVGQHGAGFSLILLKKYGNEFKSPDFYASKYLDAFNFDEEDSDSPFANRLERAYSIRTFERFLDYFGFLEFKPVDKSHLENIDLSKMNEEIFNQLFEKDHLKKTDIFDKVINILPHKGK